MPYKDREDNRAWGRRRYRRQTAERIAAGLCPNCGHRPPAPDRRLCDVCGEQRRRAERARYAQAKAEGRLYGGSNAEAKRRAARAGTKRRYDTRRDAGDCVRCGLRPPANGLSRCEPCQSHRNAGEREQWAARRARGLCGKCGQPASDGASRCESCAALQAGRPSRKAYARKLYARRRARGLCTDCGSWSAGASRCPACAQRSHARSSEHRGLPVSQPRFTVLEIANGVDHGTFESEAELAACLAFARLAPDEVEIISDVSPMATLTSW